jgi:hypothetical protein
MATPINQIQADLEAFRSGRTASRAPSATTSAPVSEAPASPIANDLKEYRTMRKSGGAPTMTKRAVPKEPSALSEFAKGLFSAPATLVARPIQAGAAIMGATNEQIDEATKKVPVVGGLIAPVPDTFGDVKKDVGRAAQTVALGTGAPIAGGALFGVGASLEQGNDLLSTETAFNAALGGGTGKVLQLVGKPLLNAAGKVVGVITPKVLKDVAAKGATAITEFAANHKLLGGIAAKPSEMIANTLQKTDDAIEGGVKKVFSGAGKVVSEQYPNASPTKYYQGVNEKDFLRPTTINEPKYSKATSVYTDAKSRGVDLEKVATKRGIIHDKIAEGGKYNTLDTVDNLREGNYKVSESIARPAIKAAEPGVAKVPVSQIRSEMLRRVNSIPSSQITPEDRSTMIRIINRRYAPDGVVSKQFKDGYSLTDLHDARIISGKNGKYKIGGTSSDALKAQLSREEGRVFAEIFDNTVPEEVGIAQFRKELEQNFLLADYLEQLHGKAVPAGITKKAIRLFGRAITATVGGKIGGFPGSILGAQYGDMLFNSFETLPNPIKIKVLESIKLQDPKIYSELIKYVGEQEIARLTRLGLPAKGGSSFKETPPTLFVTPKGKATTNLGEGVDVAGVETGRIKAPKSGRSKASQKKLTETAQEALGPYVPPNEMPVIKAGRVPRKKRNLNDIF